MKNKVVIKVVKQRTVDVVDTMEIDDADLPLQFEEFSMDEVVAWVKENSNLVVDANDVDENSVDEEIVKVSVQYA